MSEYSESVKHIADLLRESAGKTSNPDKVERLTRHAATLDLAVDEIVRLAGLTTALSPDLGNIHDLPQDLLNELSVAKNDELENQIVTVINSYDGEASLDQILVGLFRKFKVAQKRRFLMNKLYRMSMIWSVDGKKGIYTLTEPDEVEEAPVTSHGGGSSDDDTEIPF